MIKELGAFCVLVQAYNSPTVVQCVLVYTILNKCWSLCFIVDNKDNRSGDIVQCGFPDCAKRTEVPRPQMLAQIMIERRFGVTHLAVDVPTAPKLKPPVFVQGSLQSNVAWWMRTCRLTGFCPDLTFEKVNASRLPCTANKRWVYSFRKYTEQNQLNCYTKREGWFFFCCCCYKHLIFIYSVKSTKQVQFCCIVCHMTAPCLL